MNIKVKSSNGITLVPAETQLFSDRKIFLEGEIDSGMACEFAKKVMLLNQEDSSSPIDVLINSPGGEINAGLLMYDVLQSRRAPIRLFCVGKAYSMAAVLFACGSHGRYMLPHAELMLHEPLLGSQVRGNSSSIKSISDSLLETKRKLNGLLAKHIGKTVEEVEEATGYDHYFSAEESMGFGLCDGIVGFDKIMEV